MLKDVFSNRLFIGALAFFVLCVCGSLLYMQHVEKQSARELAETQEHINQLTETQKPPVEVPEGDTSQGGHTHADGTFHAAPEDPLVDSTTEQFSEPISPVAENAITAPPQMQYTKVKISGPPPSFKNVPVDLSDFEATKAAMIENVNFVKANWEPNVFNPEVHRARVYIANIAMYADSPRIFYTPEQREEIRALRFSLLDFFKGIDRKQGETLDPWLDNPSIVVGIKR